MATQNNKQVALREEHIGAVMHKVVAMQNRGELDVPPNYSVGNALNSAWLILQDVTDKDKKPVLEVCTKESIGYALLKMTIQGLNPSKDQCYFIAYGNKLTMQRSYFGTIAVLKRVDPRVAEVVAEVVYQADKLKYKLDRGRKVITDHEQALENIDDDKIKAAYCMVYDRDWNVLASSIMTMAELTQAWRQSKAYPVADNGTLKPGSTHAKFTGQMAKKTVLGRACKTLISASDDSTIVGQTARKYMEETDEEEAANEIAANANQDIIDVEVTEAKPVNPAKETKPASEQAPKAGTKPTTAEAPTPKTVNTDTKPAAADALMTEEQITQIRAYAGSLKIPLMNLLKKANDLCGIATFAKIPSKYSQDLIDWMDSVAEHGSEQDATPDDGDPGF